MKWSELTFFQSGERQVIEDKLKQVTYCPGRRNLYRALRLVPFDTVRVAIIGQDPYPDPKFATGIAFSIPKDLKEYPFTLANIFREYCEDLNYPYPPNGDLSEWCKQGVLLWNAIPTCEIFRSLSHYSPPQAKRDLYEVDHPWLGWTFLTKEIVERLSDKGIVFVLLGGKAREYAQFIDTEKSRVIELSHPSPRASRMAHHPFLGSRMFTTINGKLNELGIGPPINWRL